MSTKKNQLIGISLIISSAIAVCFGQMLWKMGASNSSLIILAGGFILYGLGALLMMISFRFGKLSVLHPMMSIGYVLSLFIGACAFSEEITLFKIGGIICVLIGLIFLAKSDKGGTAE